MWNPAKSVILSAVCTKAAIVLVMIAALAMPYLIPTYVNYTGKTAEIIPSLLITVYACAVPGLVSLICLNRLLTNIRQEEVFAEKNVRLLRILSWCSFAVAVILLVSGFYYILFVIMAVCAAFLGLILRVIKNVFEQAIIIKQENDFTI
jgi:type III secretory pathway component EscV